MSSHLSGQDRRDVYASGLTFREFLATVTTNESLWAALAQRAVISDELAVLAGTIPGSWHLLVLLEDWCGDAVNTVPVLNRLAERVPSLSLRVLLRDQHPDLMHEHLTGGKRAIPVVVVLDSEFREVGWWGPRPRELQRWTTSSGSELAKVDRYREMRRWYAVDRGRKAVEEILEIVCRAAGVTHCQAA